MTEFINHMEICDSHTFKQNEVLLDKPIYVGFAVLDLSKLHMYETYYNKLQAYFGEGNLQCLYMATDSFVLTTKTGNITEVLKIQRIYLNLVFR